MILALLVTQLDAAPCAILFSKLSGKIGAIRMIISAIAVYFVICGVGFFMGRIVEPYQLDAVATTRAAIQSPWRSAALSTPWAVSTCTKTDT